MTSAGKKMRPDTHKSCPGHAAYIGSTWRDGRAAWDVVYLCTDPAANGHTALNGGKIKDNSGIDLEKQREERQQTIAGNKAWRAAETVRREFLAQLFARKAAPKDALRFIAESIGRNDNAIRHAMERGNTLAQELLGLPKPDAPQYGPAAVRPIVDAIAKASDARAAVIALSVILAAYEDTTDVHIWKTPKSHTETARYFQALARWDYQLSPIEQATADGAEWKPAE